MNKPRRSVAGAIAVIGILASIDGRAAQPGPVTFTATAAVKSPTLNASMPVTIRIERFVSDAVRDKILAVIKAGDAAATRRALEASEDVGYIDVGKRRTPIKFASARPTSEGRLVSVLAAEPLLFLGAAAPDAKPKAGYDLALALLILDGGDKGEGELSPATKVKMNAEGAIVTEDYGREVVRLLGIARGK